MKDGSLLAEAIEGCCGWEAAAGRLETATDLAAALTEAATEVIEVNVVDAAEAIDAKVLMTHNIKNEYKAKFTQEGIFFVLKLFAWWVFSMKKLKIEKTKPTFIVKTFKVVY